MKPELLKKMRHYSLDDIQRLVPGNLGIVLMDILNNQKYIAEFLDEYCADPDKYLGEKDWMKIPGRDDSYQCSAGEEKSTPEPAPKVDSWEEEFLKFWESNSDKDDWCSKKHIHLVCPYNIHKMCEAHIKVGDCKKILSLGYWEDSYIEIFKAAPTNLVREFMEKAFTEHYQYLKEFYDL